MPECDPGLNIRTILTQGAISANFFADATAVAHNRGQMIIHRSDFTPLSASLLISLAFGLPRAATASEEPVAIPINRSWEVLTDPGDSADYRPILASAAEKLGDWTLSVAGVAIDGPRLERLANTPAEEPLLRALREDFRRAFDLEDFLLFLDDVLVAGDAGMRGKVIWVPAGRARGAGITMHPGDLFFGKPRLYAAGGGSLNVDKPKPQAKLPAAKDGDPVGPNWTVRFQNPRGEAAKMQLLGETSPTGTYTARIGSLLTQLRKQGADAWVSTTVRNRTRGYLMWGAFILSRAESDEGAARIVAKLNEKNRKWGLDAPISWRHPDGWKATIEAARQMADAYDVVYATERGARRSRHYDGLAVDITVVGLPRRLTLRAPSGRVRTFDLSDPNETRDLSLSPRLIRWVERNFQVKKLKSDYPHWTDVAPIPEAEAEPLRGG